MTATNDILPLNALDEVQREQAADILLRALAHAPSAWRTIEEARTETASFAEKDRYAFAAVREGTVLGWIGAIAGTYECGWELHPLVVHPSHQRKGIGTQLVQYLEQIARDHGILTLYLGTDDDFGATNLFGADLFGDPQLRLRDIALSKRHPMAFYRKLEWSVVGVIPDVNGRGRPDILMAKPVPV